jgi:EpsI family protein
VVANAHLSEQIGGRSLTVRERALAGPGGHLLVWQWYWIDRQTTANDYVGKLLQVRERILGRGDDGAAVLAFAPYDSTPDQARAALRAMLAANLGPLEAALEANRRH